ncbi:hypothetical protein TREMEDRAFT_65669 [Tremella mesenterica DSM 1558]|uniref:uncharacterized protein n=1 Tax=Tremella mesenterica (strain ATCC 24925 / CBS 8224 / DSM 1558 / NBRC 9311 / NRRL Y-6157 / RJB 2259-6 / UBC 559-6) TaxID=578456 RepID=UPI00032C6C0F|nr:uncharacterized protein TREMEDRAFT_65669 [Tremella mesenterica DSM 1558]EIW66386.1 hypothetical protein TREMEDRAFT_65669 [Tremella mesenterica DSM 1558]
MSNLVGERYMTSKEYSISGEKRLYFIYDNLLIRAPGKYKFKCKLLDLAGPKHIGTSNGVTSVLTSICTESFNILPEWEHHCPEPSTDLWKEIKEQDEIINSHDSEVNQLIRCGTWKVVLEAGSGRWSWASERLLS